MTMVYCDVTVISDTVHCLRPENSRVAFRRTDLSPAFSGKESGKICSWGYLSPFYTKASDNVQSVNHSGDISESNA